MYRLRRLASYGSITTGYATEGRDLSPNKTFYVTNSPYGTTFYSSMNRGLMNDLFDVGEFNGVVIALTIPGGTMVAAA